MKLTLAAPIGRWDEAIPLGNGLMGGLLWGSGNQIRVSLDRGDLWDLRPHPGYTRPGFDYSTVVKLVHAGQAQKLNEEYARSSDYPTRLPGARLVLTLDRSIEAHSFDLDLKRAEGSVDFGWKQLACFFSATEPLALIRVPGEHVGLDLVANDAVKILGYKPPEVRHPDARTVELVQDAALGFRYVIRAESRRVAAEWLVAIAITTNEDGTDPESLATQRTRAALAKGYSALFEPHRQWWSKFWARSSVTLPDEAMLRHYNLVQYFYGAASRPGAPPIPLQGVWTADGGGLPPWHGDYHHDLNTQLTYWAYLAAGHFEEGRTFLDFLWKLKPRHEEFARRFFGLSEGLIVPAVMANDGSPMGSWFPYTLSPTMSAWLAQSFYWHWRYSMDRSFLGERAYPYCTGVGEALAGLLRPDPITGFLKLPLSSSPEIHNNTQRSWLTPNSNCDLALMRWLFGANAEMASALGRNPDAVRWRRLLAKLEPLATEGDSGQLLVAPGEPLQESHRHFSHLMALHPLGILNVEGTDRDRRVIDASMAAIDRLGTSLWCGYSFSWMAAMRARLGRGDEALRFLTSYLESFTLRNGFHANGEQTRKGLSTIHGRPFTLEGNFAAARAVQEMLLQSQGGRVRVFPAMPSAWRDASFHDLRAEGGFRVSAERRDGRTHRVRVTATVEQDLRLKAPFPGEKYTANRPVKRRSDELRIHLLPGQTLELTR